MFSMLPVILVVGALAGYGSATTYAHFCDDYDCHVNCGIFVSVDNPGCLMESGRNSVGFQDPNPAQNARLLWSPDSGCSCQSHCLGDLITGTGTPRYDCFSLEGSPTANSFRFVGGGGCDPDNC